MRKDLRAAPASVAVLLLALCGCGGDRGEIVAVVGGSEVTVGQFRERYRSYLAGTGIRDNILARQQVLNNMINERLIYEDLRRRGLEHDARFLRRMEEIRMQAIVDGFARRMTTDTLRVSEEELQEEYRAYLTRASARYLYAPTEERARVLKNRLKQGEHFEDLAREVFEDPGLANNGGYLGVFGWGELEPGLEEAAFRVPLGSVSDPVRIRIGWAVVKPETRIMQPLASEQDLVRVRPKLEQAVRQKKTQLLTDAFLQAAAADLAPTFHEEVVDEVFAAWETLVEPVGRVQEGVGPAAPALREKVLGTIGGRMWTVGEFVERLEKTTARQRRRVTSPSHVREIVIGLALRDVIVDRAMREDLSPIRSCKPRSRKSSDEFRLEFWASAVQDTAGHQGWDESMLRRRYQTERDRYRVPPLVNVAEILVRTEGEAREAMALVRRGADFSRIARERSLRLWAAKKDGELGYGTSSTFGPLGQKFLAAPVGAVIGPEKVDPYYGVFKILGKMAGREKSFEEARAEIMREETAARRRMPCGVPLTRCAAALRSPCTTRRSGTLRFPDTTTEGPHT